VEGERREKVMRLKCEKQNSGGLGEKKAKTHSSQGENENISIPFLLNVSRYTFFPHDYVRLSNV
jgi:hypothetical protein